MDHWLAALLRTEKKTELFFIQCTLYNMNYSTPYIRQHTVQNIHKLGLMTMDIDLKKDILEYVYILSLIDILHKIIQIMF